VPKPLEEAEETAEDVQDDIAKAKWDDAGKKTRQLQQYADSLRRIGASASDLTAYDSAVATLVQKVESRDQMGAALAANEASRAAISMMAPYNPQVPVAVGYMDVDARNVIYHAQGADWTKAEQAARDLSSNYSQVQTHVAQQKPDLDQKVRTEIERLNSAIAQKNTAAARQSANQVLDEIDDIEKTYKGSNQGTRSTQPGQTTQGTQGTQGTQR
jgi:archaellum component FlaC